MKKKSFYGGEKMIETKIRPKYNQFFQTFLNETIFQNVMTTNAYNFTVWSLCILLPFLFLILCEQTSI